MFQILALETADRSDPLRSRAKRPFEHRGSFRFTADFIAFGRHTNAEGRPFVNEMPAVTLGNRLPSEVRGNRAVENRLKRTGVTRYVLCSISVRMAASANARADEIVERETDARTSRPNCQDG